MTDFNPQSLAQLDKSRFSGYKSNLDFYEGQQWETRSRHRQLVFNYARISVDKITSYLMKGFNFYVDPEQGHDDYLISLALCVNGARDYSPRRGVDGVRNE